MPPGIAHGGRLIEARRLYPDAPAPFIDLSTGINPFAYPLAPLAASVLARLPEPEMLAKLELIAARAYGAASPAMVVAAPGTQMLIGLLPHLLGLQRVTILGPTYGGHQAAWEAAGAGVRIESTWQGFADRARGENIAAILCNPNNPDGRVIEADQLAALACHGGVLIVDEAFADLEDPPVGLAPLLPRDGLLILRSFGKSYGLAGVRLGFLLASEAIAARIRTAFGPWAVSGPALAAGLAGLGDSGWRDAMRPTLQAACDRLDGLAHAAGLALVGGTRLFRLYRAADAAAVFDRLARRGILVRRFDDAPGTLRPGMLRIGLPGSETEWARLTAALQDALPHS
ncbi:threonine-phosphate decarboxylase CobD [Lichenicoccus sp.]|uniref:threonine-phosphate decarboxylase CobD n=1 Tax=Lichenicoccus sp. TaxID=2781899 RepID=UPI003D0D1A14